MGEDLKTSVEKLTLFAAGLRQFADAEIPALHPANYVAFAGDLEAVLGELERLSRLLGEEEEEGRKMVQPVVPTNPIEPREDANDRTALELAAPDLLAALEELLYEDSGKSDTDRIVTRLRGRAAVAKAGGQP